MIVDANGLLTATSEGPAYIEAYSDYTFSGTPYQASWGSGDDVDVTLKVTILPPDPEEEIFFSHKEGDGPTISYHVTDKVNMLCEVAGPYDEDDLLTPAIAQSYSGAVTIPAEVGGYTVTRVGAKAFYECREITAVRLPKTVTQVGSNAFYRCELLADVYIPQEQPLEFTNGDGEVMPADMGHNSAFNEVGRECADWPDHPILHVAAGSLPTWTAPEAYPWWPDWFLKRCIVDDIVLVMPGDVNGDDTVIIADVTMLIAYIMGQNPAEFVAKAADVNSDGKVDYDDVKAIVDIICGK